MKLILLLVCGVVLLQNFAFGRLHLNGDGIVGVSQKNFNEYIVKAIKGFKNVMLQGDEELGYPVMDPFKLEDVSWDYVDTSGSKKYRLKFFNKNPIFIKGLSNYEVNHVDVDAKDMLLTFHIVFRNLKTEFPYKLDGYMFKNFLPVFGEGLVKLSTKEQRFNIAVRLGTEQGFITVEKAQVYKFNRKIEAKVTGFMDLADPFADVIANDILGQIMNQLDNNAIEKSVHNLVEEAVGGMTTEEFFDYLDHFVKKNDQH